MGIAEDTVKTVRDGAVRVVIESPYSAKWPWGRRANVRYARAALLDSLLRDEAPLASHLLYTQVLDDKSERERYAGILAGFSWNLQADGVAVYIDRGISEGMRAGVEFAFGAGLTVMIRSLHESAPCNLFVPDVGVWEEVSRLPVERLVRMCQTRVKLSPTKRPTDVC